MSLSKPITFVNETEQNQQLITRRFCLPEVKTSFKSGKCIYHDHPDNQKWIKSTYEMSCLSYEAFTKIMGAGLLMHYFYPKFKDFERVEKLIKVGLALFIIDDHVECAGGEVHRDFRHSSDIWEQFGKMLNKLEDPVSVNSESMIHWRPYIVLWYTILDSIYTGLNNIQKKRLIREWRLYMEGNLEETQFIVNGRHHESIDELNKIRIKSGGVRPCLYNIEVGADIFIIDEIWNDKRFQDLLDLVTIHVTQTNDIFSFEKEFVDAKGNLNHMFNLVAVISVVDNLPIEEAMIKAAQVVVEVEEKIIELEKDLLKTIGKNYPPELDSSKVLENTRLFIDCLNDIMGGNNVVSSMIDRYNKIENSNN